MASVVIDGIETRYELVGSGPPLLLYAPGGFEATIEKWSTQGIYARIKPVDHLSQQFSCILFDRRECGRSGGRVERVTWAHYVAQGRGLLDHLRIDKAFLMGGCMGCAPVYAFAVAHPQRVLGQVLFWPVGGPRYRLTSQQRFAEHLSFVQAEGLDAVVTVAKAGKSFGGDPRGGPWASVIRNDSGFAAAFAAQDAAHYKLIVASMGRTLVDRDTAPGPEPEDLMQIRTPTLIIPGADASHATSAARYLQECISGAEYWDVPPEAQTEAAAAPKLLSFLQSIRQKSS